MQSGDPIVWDLNVSTGTFFITRRYFELLGYEPDSFIETYASWSKRVHPDEGQSTLREFETYLAGNIPEFSTQFRMQTSSGGWVWVRSCGAIVERDETGRPLRAIGTMTDISQRDESQKVAKQLQQRLRNALNLTQSGDWTWVPETDEFWRSEENHTLYRFASDVKLSYDAFLEIVHGQDQEEFVREFEAIIRSGDLREFEFRINRSDGEVRWIRSVIRAVRGLDRDLVRLEGIDQDITERKETELRLRESEARFQAFVEHASDAFFLHGEEGVILDVNQVACDRLGYTREELIGSFASKFDIDITNESIAKFRQRLESGKTITFASRHQRRDGTCFPVEIRVRPFIDQGRMLAFSLVQDITERRRVEAALRSEQQFSKAILENAAVVILVLDREGRIVRFNHAAERLSGYTFQEVEGCCPWDVMLPPEEAEKIRREVFAKQFLKAPGETGRYRNEWVTKDGRRRLLDWHNTYLRQDEGQNKFLVAVGVDVTEHHQMETALRESEGTLRAIFESDPNCIKLVDQDCTLLEMNSAGLAMVGATTVDQARGRSVLEFVVPVDRERVRLDIAKAIKGQQTLTRFQIVRSDGTRMHVEQHAVGLRDSHDSKRISRVLAITRDVTEQHRVAEIERRRVEKLRRLSQMALPLAGEPIVVLGQLLRVVSEVFEAPIVLLTEIHGDTLKIRLAYFEGVLQHNVAQYPLIDTPCRLLVESQAVRVAERVAEQFPGFELLRDHRAETYCGAPAIDGSGNVLGGLCLLDRRNRNFSDEDLQFMQLFGQRLAIELEREREQAVHRAIEENLRQSENRLSEAQRIAHVGNWFWDISSDSITWSDEVFRIFGYDPQAFPPRFEVEFMQSIPAEDRERVSHTVQTALKDGEPYQVSHRVIRPDGSERIVREQGEVVYDETGRPIRMLGTVQDITDVSLAQEQMESLRNELTHVARLAMLGEMLTGIAHELNQPLAAITNNAYTIHRTMGQLVKDDATPLLSHALQSSLEIESQAVRAGEIIRRLILLLRKQPPRRTTVNLQKLIDEVVNLMAAEIRAADVSLELQLPIDFPAVVADPIQLQQVLLNLLRNSVESLQHSLSPRNVTIQVLALPGDGAEIRVRDTGPGLDPSMEGRVFTPFATTKPDGVGFGLAMTRRIVEAHGGEIHLHSESGRGVEVSFTLPASDVQLRNSHA